MKITEEWVNVSHSIGAPFGGIGTGYGVLGKFGCKCQVLKYDLTGREFGYLKVIDRASKGNRKSNEVYWRCLCRNCGRIVHISSYQLRHSNPYGHCNCTRFHVAAESATTRKDEHRD